MIFRLKDKFSVDVKQLCFCEFADGKIFLKRSYVIPKSVFKDMRFVFVDPVKMNKGNVEGSTINHDISQRFAYLATDSLSTANMEMQKNFFDIPVWDELPVPGGVYLVGEQTIWMSDVDKNHFLEEVTQ